MRYSKLNPVLRSSVSNIQDSATPTSISYAYNFGSLLGIFMGIMLITGILLAMQYIGTASNAFNSVSHIMNDIQWGYIIRYIHANSASFVFICVYGHIIRNIFYASYRMPRVGTWLTGNIIIVLIIGTAFLGYSLVYGQMSLWGATVISNLATAIPYIGTQIAILLWGGYSVASPTVTRFFALHYLLAIIVVSLAVIHLLILHMHASSTPIGISSNYDKSSMQPVFLVKDSITIVLLIAIMLFIVCNYPNMLGHNDNFIEANSLVTPTSIVPEWYLLSYYAILRSVPNKLIGVILMLVAILWLAVLVFDTNILRSAQYKLLTRVLLVIGIYTFIQLIELGSQHVEAPYILLGQLSTVIYFGVLLVSLPIIGIIENALMYKSIPN